MTDTMGTNFSNAHHSNIPAGLIRPHHRRRSAIVYLRQSTPGQVEQHFGSTDSQRSLTEVAARLGWPDSLTIVIDDDLGVSGTSTVGRGGFQRLLDMMSRGEIGIVIVRDISRLSREPADSERFLMLAIRTSTLIAVNGQVYDPAGRDLAELFGLRIQSLLAWWDNAQRVATFRRAKEAKVAKGFAVTRPPIGYVSAGKGQWTKDPDAAIRDAVRRVFDLYLEHRSVRKVSKTMYERGLKFPQRQRGSVQWRFLTTVGVLTILRNPNYTNDYNFRRRHLLPKDERGVSRLAPVPEGDWLVARNHHDGYVTSDEWRLIQATLTGQGRGPNRRPAAGEGHALLQGLVVCGECGGRRVRTYHDGR
jgi:DNA invertase Pin-like site-specific DNA recombinase